VSLFEAVLDFCDAFPVLALFVFGVPAVVIFIFALGGAS
jgi:hypothetical protein